MACWRLLLQPEVLLAGTSACCGYTAWGSWKQHSRDKQERWRVKAEARATADEALECLKRDVKSAKATLVIRRMTWQLSIAALTDWRVPLKAMKTRYRSLAADVAALKTCYGCLAGSVASLWQPE